MFLLVIILILMSCYVAENNRLQDSTKTVYWVGFAIICVIYILTLIF